MLSPLGHQHERGGGAGYLVASCLLLGAGLLALGVWQETRIQHLADQVASLAEELELVKLLQIQERRSDPDQDQGPEYYLDQPSMRVRREAESPVQLSTTSPLNMRFLSEDGIPIHSSKYKEGTPEGTKSKDLDAGDALGFKVYNAWFQHKREKDIRNDPRVVWSHPTDSPIRPYHRKSAAWSSLPGDYRDEEEEGSEEDSFKKFGGSLYKDDTKKIKTNSDANSINLGRNRAKITNPKEYQSSRQVVITTTENPITTTTTTTTATSRPVVQIFREKVSSSNSNSSSSSTNLVWNEHMVNKIGLRQRSTMNRSSIKSAESPLGRKRMSNRDLLRSARARGSPGLTGLTAVHLQAKLRAGVDGESRNSIADGTFRDWTFARWAKRMRLEDKFPLKDGKLGVPAPGLYYVYAQVNYLDENDVNAFQIYVNESPFVMCTTMTHTPQFTTKANTCHTGGVVFLEQGDTLHVQNMEQNRYSVMLPAHTFFGLIQLSVAGI